MCDHKSAHHEQTKAEPYNQAHTMVEMHTQYLSVWGVGEPEGLFLIVRVHLPASCARIVLLLQLLIFGSE